MVTPRGRTKELRDKKSYSVAQNSPSLAFHLVSYVGEGHGGLYKAPKRKKGSERLRGEGDQIKFIDLRFKRWQIVRLRKARRRQDVP